MEENSWAPNLGTIDLLKDFVLTIPLPVLTITPKPCFTTTWGLYRASDDVNVASEMANVFVIGGQSLDI